MEAEKKAFEDFLKPRFDAGLILGPILLVIGIVCLVNGGIIIGLLMLVAGGLLLATAIRIRTQFAALMNESAPGELAALLSDFRTATPIAEGNIRLGDRYFYPWRGGRYIAYGDVLKVYQAWYMLDEHWDAWNVIALVRAGEETEKVTLFTSVWQSDCSNVLREVEQHLLARNPNIQFGSK